MPSWLRLAIRRLRGTMTNIAMLVVCLVVGMILRITRRVPVNAHVSINAFIIHVALPADRKSVV